MRYSLLIILKSLTITLLISVLLSLTSDIFTPKHTDFIEYYASGKLLQLSENPYSYPEQTTAQTSIHKDEIKRFSPTEILNGEIPIMYMFNPPFILSFCLVYNHLGDFFTAFRTQVIFSLFAYIFSIFICCKILLKNTFPSSFFKLSFLFLITCFSPILQCIKAGQITPIILLCFSLTLAFEIKKLPFLSAFFLGFTLIKPHPLYLFYILWFFYEAKSIKAKALGLFTSISILSIIPLYYRPSIFIDYFNFMQAQPPASTFIATTIGAWLQLIFNSNNSSSIAFIPTFICILLTAMLLLKQFHQPNIKMIQKVLKSYDSILLYIIPISLITAPYGWGYEHILLIPSFVVLFNKINRIYLYNKKSSIVFTTILLLLNVVILPLNIPQHYLIVYPILFILIITLIRKELVK